MSRKSYVFAWAILLATIGGCTEETLLPPEVVVDGSVVVDHLPVGVNYDTTITVRNLGGEDLTIEHFHFAGAGLIQVLTEAPITIIGGDSVNIQVRIHVITSGRFHDTIEVHTSDPVFPEVPIAVRLTTLTYELVQSGWLAFETDNIASGLSSFDDAITRDVNYAEAYVGRGWCLLKNDALATSIVAFNTAIGHGAGDDARAGRALAHLNDENFSQAVADVDAVVTVVSNTASSYTFPHDDNVTETDLLWVKARAYFLLGDYPSAQIVVNVLDPLNALNPESPSYITELAELIEQLRTTV